MNTKLYALLLTLACATGDVHASDGSQQEQPGSAENNQTDEERVPLVRRGNKFYLPADDPYKNEANSNTTTSGQADSASQRRASREVTLSRLMERATFGNMSRAFSGMEAPSNSPEQAARRESLSQNRGSSQQPTEGETSNPNSPEQAQEVTYRLPRSPVRRSSTNRSLSPKQRDSDTK